MTPEQIKDRYQDRILAVMNRIATVLQDEGYPTEGPHFMDGDSYSWNLIVHLDADPDEVGQEDIDISFKVCESEQYDVEEGGINFALDIVEIGGRILGGLTPYNYSPKCWVDRTDAEAIEERFKIMEDADETVIPALIER